MLWENLTSVEFEQSIKLTNGVAIIPIGCLEKHGYHLPLGSDMFIAKYVANKASELEESLVVPIAPYGIISEAAHRTGCLSISSKLQYEILEELCDELSRNGYKKIILINSHGGAVNFLKYFAQSRLEKYHPYIIYLYQAYTLSPQQHQDFIQMNGPLNGSGHADLMETSAIMYTNPDTVHLEKIIVEETRPKYHLTSLSENRIFTAISWYSNFPHHIAGDPTDATREKGEYIINLYVKNFAEVIKTVKNDDTALKLQEEFYKMREKPQI